jgi:hypothetical protein
MKLEGGDFKPLIFLLEAKLILKDHGCGQTSLTAALATRIVLEQ